MGRSDYLVLRILIFLTIVFFSHKVIFKLITPIVVQDAFQQHFKVIDFIFTVVGLHAVFALITFIIFRFKDNKALATIFLKLSWLIPLIYSVFNLRIFKSFSSSALILSVCIVSLIDLKFSTYIKSLVKKYISLIQFQDY